MPLHSFIAYIDESGDDGLGKFRKTGDRGGASSWLVISACVFRFTYDLDAVAWRDEISDKMAEKKSRQIHFWKMNHSQKTVAAQCLANKSIRAINILSNKTTIPAGTYNEKNQLYFYLTRYLIERISWLCRDLRPTVPQGNGTVKIIFSRRGGLSYSDFKQYLLWLKIGGGQDVNIHWPVIDIDAIDAQDHSKLAGLQIADALASAFATGVEPDRYGNCESRYAELLRPIVYHRKGNYLSYGFKMVPHPDTMQLTPEQLRTVKYLGKSGSPPAHDCDCSPAIFRMLWVTPAHDCPLTM